MNCVAIKADIKMHVLILSVMGCVQRVYLSLCVLVFAVQSVRNKYIDVVYTFGDI